MMHSMVVDVTKLDETLKGLKDDVVVAVCPGSTAPEKGWHVTKQVILILNRVREM